MKQPVGLRRRKTALYIFAVTKPPGSGVTTIRHAIPLRTEFQTPVEMATRMNEKMNEKEKARYLAITPWRRYI